MLKHRLHALPVRAFFRVDCELHRLLRPASEVFRIRVIFADNGHRAQSQLHRRRQALQVLGEQESLFAGEERRQHADEFRALLRGYFSQIPAYGRKQVAPACGSRLPVFTSQRPPQPFRRVHIVVAEAALVAHEIALGLRVLARSETVDDVFIGVEIDAAPRAAIRAHAVLLLQVPDALLVEEILAAGAPTGQRSTTLPASLFSSGWPGKTSI